MKTLLPLLVIPCLLAGCTTLDYRYSEKDAAALIRQVTGTNYDQPHAPILELSDAARAALDARISPRWSDTHKLEQLRAFLFHEDELGISYDATRTLTAMELWEQRRGNCLAMTNLFIAAARHVGLDARYQSVAVRPTWDNTGAAMVRYEHIIAVGRMQRGEEYVMDFLPEFLIGENNTLGVTDTEAMALYFNNLGAEKIIEGDQDAAIRLLRDAIRLDPDLSDAWNNIGAAYRRDGQPRLAEFAWQHAMRLDEFNYSALSNLAQFYERRNRRAEYQYYAQKVEKYRDKNPWFHYFLAGYLYENGEYDDAIDYLERSLRLKEDEPRFYEAMARVYSAVGDNGASASYMTLADQYRTGDMRVVPRESNHRFWTRSINFN